MSKGINKEKCIAWVETLIAITKISAELSCDEFEYIRSNLTIAMEKIKIQKLEEKYEIQTRNKAKATKLE